MGVLLQLLVLITCKTKKFFMYCISNMRCFWMRFDQEKIMNLIKDNNRHGEKHFIEMLRWRSSFVQCTFFDDLVVWKFKIKRKMYGDGSAENKETSRPQFINIQLIMWTHIRFMNLLTLNMLNDRWWSNTNYWPRIEAQSALHFSSSCYSNVYNRHLCEKGNRKTKHRRKKKHALRNFMLWTYAHNDIVI